MKKSIGININNLISGITPTLNEGVHLVSETLNNFGYSPVVCHPVREERGVLSDIDNCILYDDIENCLMNVILGIPSDSNVQVIPMETSGMITIVFDFDNGVN